MRSRSWCNGAESCTDPLVVDTFINIHSQIAPPADVAVNEKVLREITTAVQARGSDQQGAGLQNIAAGSGEVAAMFDLAQAITAQSSQVETADAVASRLCRMVPFALVVFYSYDMQTDEVVAWHAVGEGAALVRGLRISVAQRLSGWVATNRQTIMNSDAILDLGEIAKVSSPRLRTCLSTPLLASERLVGVITLYSSAQGDFTEDHGRILERVADLIAPKFVEKDNTSNAPLDEASALNRARTSSPGRIVH